MESSILDWHFSLLPGFTTIAYNQTERQAIICSTENPSFKLLDIDSGQEKEIDAHDEGIFDLSISRNDSKLVTCSSDRTVKLWHFPSQCDHSTLITRFDSAVYAVDFSPEGQVACGAADGTIKLVNSTDIAKVIQFKAHQGVVKSLSFHPNQLILASAGSDGLVNIWTNLSQASPTRIASLLIIPHTGPENDRFSRLSWHPQGEMLAVPTLTGVFLVESKEWKVKSKLIDHQVECIGVSWSNSGLYLASTHLQGICLIWNMTTKCVQSRLKSHCLITSMAWDGEKRLVLANEHGHYAEWTSKDWKNDHLVTTSSTNMMLPPATHLEPLEGKGLSSAQQRLLEQNTLLQSECRTNCIEGHNKMVPRQSLLSEYDDISTELILDSGDDNSRQERLPQSKLDLPCADISSFPSDPLIPSWPQSSPALSFQTLQQSSQPNTTPNLLFPQPAFHSNASPTHLNRRYLAWNSSGIVTARYEPDSTHLEVVCLTQEAYNRRFTLSKPLRIELASLGPASLLMASMTSKDPNSNSHYPDIFFHAFQHWGLNANWTAHLPVGESVRALATGDTYAVVSTSNQLLRIFGPGGVQNSVLSLSGPVVTLSASAKWLAVVYHIGAPFAEQQNLGYSLLQIDANVCPVQDIRLPLSPNSQLQWLGFGENITLATLDSVGVMRILRGIPSLSNNIGAFTNVTWITHWTPVLNTCDLVSDGSTSIWPITIKGDKLQYVTCNPALNSPNILPRPVPSSIPLEIPLAHVDSGAHNPLEMQYLLANIHYNHLVANFSAGLQGFEELQGLDKASISPILAKDQAQCDQILLRLIKVACEEDRGERALGLCKQLTLKKSYKIAIEISQRTDQHLLADKLLESLEEPGLDKAGEMSASQSATASTLRSATTLDSNDQSFSGPIPLPNSFSMASPTEEGLLSLVSSSSSSNARKNMDADFELVNDSVAEAVDFPPHEISSSVDRPPTTTISSFTGSILRVNPFGLATSSSTVQSKSNNIFNILTNIQSSPKRKKTM